MRDYTGLDLVREPGSLPVRKKRPLVHACFATAAGFLDTLEGLVPYQPGDALVRGLSGERWPVARERFLVTYRAIPPTVNGSDGFYLAEPIRARAFQMPEDGLVKTSGGATLQGRQGDWLLKYEAGDYGIVQADLFAGLYERIEDWD